MGGFSPTVGVILPRLHDVLLALFQCTTVSRPAPPPRLIQIEERDHALYHVSWKYRRDLC